MALFAFGFGLFVLGALLCVSRNFRQSGLPAIILGLASIALALSTKLQ